MATKLHVNIRSLLARCEELVQDEANHWRLKKYINSLNTMVDELRDYEDPQSKEKILGYVQRLQALKMLSNYEDSQPTATNVLTKSMRASETGDVALKEIEQLQATKQHNDVRKALLGEPNLRQRKLDSGNADNMNEAINFYSNAQERITEHMLSLTRNLKEQTETANRIIRKDTEIVERSTGATDQNINALHKETERLQEHSKKAWKCWMWMMIVFVIAVFVGMVLFMKIMKKGKV